MVKESSTLRLYVDSAEVNDWQRYLATGVFFGVTTNPKLLHQAGINFAIDPLARLANTAFELGANEIHIQVWGREKEPMLEIGRELAGIDPRVMVKVPLNLPGIYCARELIAEGCNVTLTAVHSAQQALIAVALGACYAAPYLGRMTDGGYNGIQEVTSMMRMIEAINSPLRLLVASIRLTADLVTLAERGVNTFTILPPLIDDLFENELTQRAVDSFEAAVTGNQE